MITIHTLIISETQLFSHYQGMRTPYQEKAAEDMLEHQRRMREYF